jgi:hypothetical protein
MRVMLSLLAVLVLGSAGLADVTLVQDQKPVAAIHVSATASAPERFAARELQAYIQKASGAQLPLKIGRPAAGETAVVVATVDQAPQLGLRLRPAEQKLGPEGLARRLEGQHLLVLGGGPRGIVYSAYDLLESLGYRWYWPGELGEVTPRLTTVTVTVTRRVFEPSFARRHAMGGGDPKAGADWNRDVKDWLTKNHQNFWVWPVADDPEFMANRGGTLVKVGSGHNWQHIISPKVYFKDHPEYFALVRGKRITDGMLCLTNPEVQKLLLAYALEGAKKMATDPDILFIDMTANDGHDWCQCEPCKAIDDKDPTTHADILLWALNPIAEAVARENPKALLHTYIYAGADGPPSWIKPAANIHCEQTNYCYNYGVSFLRPEGAQAKFKEKFDAWTELATIRGIYEYFGFYNWLEALPVTLYRLQEEVNYYKQNKVHGFYSETGQRWATNHLLYYAFSRVWWDHTTDVPAMLDEFFRLFYGPAEQPMRRFYLALETSGGPDRYISGNEFDLYGLFNQPLREQCRADLEEAKRLAAKDEKVKARLAFVELGWEYTEKHLTAMEAHQAFRQKPTPEAREAARQAWEAYVECFDRMTGTRAFDEGDLLHFKVRAQQQRDAYRLNLAALPAGEVAYADTLHTGGNARLHGQVEGFYNGTWGLSLYKRGRGTLTYELGAQAGHTWQALTVALATSWREGLAAVVEVSTDNQTWRPLAENKALTIHDEFDLTEIVKGQARLWLRVRYASTLDQEAAAVHTIKIKGHIQ